MLVRTPTIQIVDVQTLSDDWFVLKKTVYDYQRSDGSWQRHSRETYDRGNGATILLYNRAKGTVILTRQFRYPTYVNGYHGMMIETCAGLLDEESPEESIRRETEEETGYRIDAPRKVFESYMSPGSVTEKLFFFVAEYSEDSKVDDGGGLASDQEDIEILELPLAQALAMIETGEIVDGKTIMLLQYAALHGLV
ncbi:MAG: GDP-mannose pyrophosphatase NudK [Chloroflexi bacterium]|nr:GDP-mannose pyrophosphatase NudK [Chloroflexota bacterium]